jgi:hypothetical protein
MPVPWSSPSKATQVRQHRTTMPVVSLLIHSRREAVLAVAMIYSTICNKWEINSEYEKVLS